MKSSLSVTYFYKPIFHTLLARLAIQVFLNTGFCVCMLDQGCIFSSKHYDISILSTMEKLLRDYP